MVRFWTKKTQFLFRQAQIPVGINAARPVYWKDTAGHFESISACVPVFQVKLKGGFNVTDNCLFCHRSLPAQ
jgi:hypothetical protein